MIKKVSSWGKLDPRMFLLLPDNKEIMQWISEKKSPGKSRINLNKVTRIFFGTNDTKRLKNIKKKLTGSEELCVGLISEKVGDYKSSLDLVFDTSDHMKLFVTGIQILINMSHS